MKLIAPIGRVIIKIDIEAKNSHTFSDGTKIRLERVYDNFNMRYVKPVNAVVVAAKDIPEGSEILIHHNATHDTYRLFDYRSFSEEITSDVKYYSIPDSECFFWREGIGHKWKPLGNYVTGLRIYQPYKGFIEGIAPLLIKDKLYITSGSLKGNVVSTLKASDYQIIFQNDEGREDNLIRLRYYEDGSDRNEIISIEHYYTELVESGELLIGYIPSDAIKLKEEVCQ
jgi:hypothetical protein